MLLITSCTSFLWKYAFIYLRYIRRCGITDSIILCLSFWRTAKLFWKVATQIYTPMSNVQQLHFFYFLTNTLEMAMAPHSSTLAWKTPWTEEPGGLQSRGSRRVGHNWVTSLSLFTFMHWRRKWQPTLVFLPGESQGWGSLWAAVYGVTQSQTQLKWLSSRVLYVTLCQSRRYWHGFVASVWWQF